MARNLSNLIFQFASLANIDHVIYEALPHGAAAHSGPGQSGAGLVKRELAEYEEPVSSLSLLTTTHGFSAMENHAVFVT